MERNLYIKTHERDEIGLAKITSVALGHMKQHVTEKNMILFSQFWLNIVVSPCKCTMSTAYRQ